MAPSSWATRRRAMSRRTFVRRSNADRPFRGGSRSRSHPRCSDAPARIDCGHLSDYDRNRNLGSEQHRRVGVRHYKLRVLDRYRPCRDAHLGRTFPVPPEVAHLGQPRRRSNDHLRSHLRRYLPVDPYGTPLARLLDDAIPQHARFTLDQLPLSARVGLLCDRHLLYDLPSSSGTWG